MNAAQRADEVASLKVKYREALCTPLFSEGAMSSTQLCRMSGRQRTKYYRNAQLRMNIESQIRYLQQTDDEIAADLQARALKKASSRVAQLKSILPMWRRVGIGKRGTIKPSYQKQIDAAEAELASIYSQYPTLNTN